MRRRARKLLQVGAVEEKERRKVKVGDLRDAIMNSPTELVRRR